MVKIIISILCLVSLTATVSHAQRTEAEQRASVKAEAQKMADALMKGDADAFIAFLPAKFIEKSGGVEKFTKEVKSNFSNVSASIVSCTVGEPSKFFYLGSEIQCIINDTVRTKMDVGKVVSATPLLAFSSDEGVHWTFINAGASSKLYEHFKEAYPTVAPELEKELYRQWGK
jgi:hypothetical protein